MKYLDWNPDLYLPVISCMEAADDPIMSAQGCISQLSTASYDDVNKCAQVYVYLIQKIIMSTFMLGF